MSTDEQRKIKKINPISHNVRNTCPINKPYDPILFASGSNNNKFNCYNRILILEIYNKKL